MSLSCLIILRVSSPTQSLVPTFVIMPTAMVMFVGHSVMPAVPLSRAAAGPLGSEAASDAARPPVNGPDAISLTEKNRGVESNSSGSHCCSYGLMESAQSAQSGSGSPVLIRAHSPSGCRHRSSRTPVIKAFCFYPYWLSESIGCSH